MRVSHTVVVRRSFAFLVALAVLFVIMVDLVHERFQYVRYQVRLQLVCRIRLTRN